MFSDNFGRKGLLKKTKDNIFLSSHKTILYSALIGLFLLFFALDSFAVDWYDSNWSYRKKITIDHTKVADVATPSTTYANFPVLVNLTGLTNVTDANGGDIRFTSSDGTTELAREIVNFSAGTLYAYVKVTLTKDSGDSTDDVIYIYYGSAATEPSASSTYGSENAWDSNFTMVQHFTETSGTHYDSTSNANDSITIDVTDQGDAAIQKIFGADQFVGGSLNEIRMPLLRYLINNWKTDGTDQGTIEVWMYPTGASPSNNDIFQLACAWADNWGQGGVFRGEYPAGSGIDRIWVKGVAAEIPVTYTVDQWVKITWVYTTDGVLHAYKNGTEISSAAGTAVSGYLFVGSGSGNCYFTGNIDELHTSDIPRPAEWIATSYQNENAPVSGGFFSAVGSEIGRTATFTWDGSASTDWNTASNWDVNAVPGSGHTVIIPSGGTNAPTLDSTRTIAALTVNGETLTLSSNSLTVTGNLTISGSGVIDATGGAPIITVGGDWDSSSGTFTRGTSTVDLTGSGTITITSNYWTKPFYNLNAAVAGQTTTMVTGIAIANVLTLGTGTITGTGGIIVSKGSGTPLVTAGATISPSESFKYGGSTGGVVNVTATTYSTGLWFAGNASSNTFNLAGDIVCNSLTIAGNGVNDEAILDTTSNNYSITASSLYIGHWSSTDRYGKLIVNASSIDVNGEVLIRAPDASGINELDAGSGTINVSGNWTNSDTFTAGTSTITFDGTGGTSLVTSGGDAFNNLTIEDGDGGTNLTVQLLDDTTVAGNLLVTDGTLDYNSQTLTLSGTSKNFTIDTSGIVTGSGGTTNITGSITYTDGSTSGTQNIGALIVD